MPRNVVAGPIEYICSVRETRLVTVTYERKVLAHNQEAVNLIMNNDMAQLWADIEDSNKGKVTIRVVHE